jgi:hypothetical protein
MLDHRGLLALAAGFALTPPMRAALQYPNHVVIEGSNDSGLAIGLVEGYKLN